MKPLLSFTVTVVILLFLAGCSLTSVPNDTKEASFGGEGVLTEEELEEIEGENVLTDEEEISRIKSFMPEEMWDLVRKYNVCYGKIEGDLGQGLRGFESVTS